MKINRTVLTLRPMDKLKDRKASVRLFIREGVVMQPDVDARIAEGVQKGELTIVSLRRTGEPRRSLVVDEA